MKVYIIINEFYHQHGRHYEITFSIMRVYADKEKAEKALASYKRYWENEDSWFYIEEREVE